MKITEIFESIQGEGPYVGHRAVFIRLFGCNLDCPWCDTKYSREEGNIYYELSIESILDTVLRIPGIKHIVITGGEPTLQMEELVELATKLKDLGRFVTLETNGTNPVDPKLFGKIMVSPKNLSDAEKWLTVTEVDFKFVCTPENVDEILQWTRSHGVTKCYMMPQGTSANDILVGSMVILDKMSSTYQDHILCPRLHVLMGLR